MAVRTFSYWEQAHQLTFKGVPPPSLQKIAEVLIVGAGFCGAWLAYFLKRKHPQLQISIVERDFFSLGASARNAGFLSCGNISEWLEDSRAFSWAETVATLQARIGGIEIIRREMAGRLTTRACGSIDCDPLTDEKRELIEKLNRELVAQERSPFFSVQRVNLGGRSLAAAFNEFDGEVDPCELLLALHQELRKQGVHFVWGSEVVALGDGKGLLSTLGKQSEVTYGHAFVCTNAFAKKLNPGSNVLPARGQILVTSPVRTPTTKALGFFRAGYDYFRFIGERVLVGGGRLAFQEKENTDELAVTQDLLTYLTELAREVIGHSDFSIGHHWSGIMGLRGGQHASITDLLGRVVLDSKTEELAGFGGWGVTLAPFVTQQRAEAFFV